MKLIYKNIIFLFISINFLLIGHKAVAQDLHFSQYFEQTPLRNPALAGLFKGDIKLSGNFRNQWASVTKYPFKTGAASIEIKFPLGQNNNTWLTTGMQTVFDKAGELGLGRTQILPFVNLYKKINDGEYVSAGVIAGWTGSQFDATKLRLGDQWVNGFYNPGNPTAQTFSRTSYGYFDMGAGVSYNRGDEESDQLYAGLAIFHVNRPKVAFYNNNDSSFLPVKYVLNAGYSMFVGDENRITFHGDYYKQGVNNELILGALYTFSQKVFTQTEDRNQISFGAMYRHKDAIIPMAQFRHYSGLNIGISYDANISQLRTASNLKGGFELNLSKTFTLRQREVLPCPYFQY